MAATSNILLNPLPSGAPVKITQLYPYLELLSEGEPPRQSLFVMGHVTALEAMIAEGEQDQLLIIDPPSDVGQRFRVGTQAAALFTGAPEPTQLSLLQTQPGGVGHLRIGDHFLDIYSQPQGNIVHLPALGILCSGDYGSDIALPEVAEESDGGAELETLRLLARLVKEQRLQLFVPRLGSVTGDKMAIMERLAGDVAYLHQLQRVMRPLVARGEATVTLMQIADTLLPRERRSALAQAIHRRNLSRLQQSLV